MLEGGSREFERESGKELSLNGVPGMALGSVKAIRVEIGS